MKKESDIQKKHFFMRSASSLCGFITVGILAFTNSSLAQSWVTLGSPGFSSATVNYGSIAIDGSGTPFVVYPDSAYNYQATVKKFNGSSWVTVGNPGFSAGGVFYTDIAISSTGTPYVVYQDASVGNASTVMEYNGVGWVNVGTQGFSYPK